MALKTVPFTKAAKGLKSLEIIKKKSTKHRFYMLYNILERN